MTNEQAKEVLALYRPGTDDPNDPETAEALALARRDPELARWLENQVACYEAVRAKLKAIEVPPPVWESIPADKSATPVRWRRPVLLVAAIVIGLCVVLGALRLVQPESNRFEAYRKRMVRTAMENYTMDLRTNDLNRIREFLAKHHGHFDYSLTKPMEQLPGEGCAVLRWHNRNVSMVCFDLGDEQDLYLFIINAADLSDPPASAPPQFAKVGRLATASWSAGGKAYLLAGPGDEASIRKFL